MLVNRRPEPPPWTGDAQNQSCPLEHRGKERKADLLTINRNQHRLLLFH